MPRRKKRKYGKLTQAMILQRLTEGTLLVCFKRLTLFTTLTGAKSRKRLKEITHWRKYRAGRRKEYPCVKLRWKNCQCTISLHCLAWLAYSLEEIPEGYEVDHVNGDKEDWHYDNLQLLSRKDHRSKHNEEEFT